MSKSRVTGSEDDPRSQALREKHLKERKAFLNDAARAVYTENPADRSVPKKMRFLRESGYLGNDNEDYPHNLLVWDPPLEPDFFKQDHQNHMRGCAKWYIEKQAVAGSLSTNKRRLYEPIFYPVIGGGKKRNAFIEDKLQQGLTDSQKHELIRQREAFNALLDRQYHEYVSKDPKEDVAAINRIKDETIEKIDRMKRQY